MREYTSVGPMANCTRKTFSTALSILLSPAWRIGRIGFDVWQVLFQPWPMNTAPSLDFDGVSRRAIVLIIIFNAAFACSLPILHGAESNSEPAWRPLPLITKGKVDSSWVHLGWGGFVVDDGALRTECDPKGLGLLVYRKERFGNCQIRVVFKSKEAKSNSGVYVRIADGILEPAEIGRAHV